MTKSKLTDKTILSPNNSGKRNQKICKITPHHMAGNLTIEQCGAVFQNTKRQASSNYGIGSDGRIACYVEEQNRAWTSSSSWNDNRAITIEVANSYAGGNWPVSAKAWASLVNLCVDICTRYKFRLSYDGTRNAALTEHRMFAATGCPGDYLHDRMQELVKTVNKKLDLQEVKEDMAMTKAELEKIALEVWRYKNKKLETGDAYQILRDIRDKVEAIDKRVSAIEKKL